MAKVLYIKANAKPEGESRTFKISDAFVEKYSKEHPEDEIVVLDLYKEKIDFLSENDLKSIANPQDLKDENHPVFKYAYQFLNSDKIILAAPLWNLGFPAIVKAYLDYITVNTITFKYTADGAVGLCSNKKAIHIVARGGYYSEGPFADYEMGDRYLKTLFAFLGIYEFATIAADGLDVIGNDSNQIVTEAIEKAIDVANKF